MERGLLVAIAAILVALIGFASIYNSIEGLKEELRNTQEEVKGLREELEKARSTYASEGQVESLSSKLDELGREIADISSKLERAASQEDLEEIVARLADVEARLNQLSKLEEATTGLGERISVLSRELAGIKEDLARLSERILFPVTVTDATGDQIFIPSRPTRIVSLAPSVTETLYYVGALDRIVGVDENSDYPPVIGELVESGNVTVVGGFWNPSIEAILSLEPDLVIGVDAQPHIQVKEVLSGYGIPVVILPQNSIEDVKKSVVMVGLATGNLEEAVDVLSAMDEKLAKVRMMASNITDPLSVALIVWVNPIFVAGGETFQNDIIEYAGGVNVFSNTSGWPMVGVEDLLEAKPDVIILSHGLNVSQFIDYLVSQVGEDALQIPAIKERRVYVIEGMYGDMMSRPSPRVADIVILIQYILYPELYGSTPSEIPTVVSPETVEIPGQ